MKRLLFLFLLAMLAFPVVASAMFPADELPDSPLRHENNPAAQVTAGPQITVTREGSSNTLPIVLAAASLGIALGGTAYMTVRVRSV